MRNGRLIATAVVVACLALGACGSDGEGSDVSLPSSISRPDRSTTAPSDTGTSEPPATEAPTTETPEAPTTDTQTTEAPEAPTTETPTTAAPTTETPTTAAPTTETPTTEVPTTAAPTTETPTTAAPTTETPTTEVPTTTAPTTEVPTTVAPTTETPTTVAPTSVEETADDSTLWWPWLLAGLAVVGLVAFLVVRRSRRATAWEAQTASAFDEAARLATHLAAVAPEGAAMVASEDAAQLATLAATLSTLGAGAPDEVQQRAIGSVRDQVQVLHGVVDGIAMGSGPVSPTAFDYLREQATALHGATVRARAEVLPATPGPGGPASS